MTERFKTHFGKKVRYQDQIKFLYLYNKLGFINFFIQRKN